MLETPSSDQVRHMKGLLDDLATDKQVLQGVVQQTGIPAASP